MFAVEHICSRACWESQLERGCRTGASVISAGLLIGGGARTAGNDAGTPTSEDQEQSTKLSSVMSPTARLLRMSTTALLMRPRPPFRMQQRQPVTHASAECSAVLRTSLATPNASWKQKWYGVRTEVQCKQSIHDL